MQPNEEWDLIRPERPSMLGSAGMSAVRVALLFGSAAAALALVLAPVADTYTRPQFAQGLDGVDRMATGSIKRARDYTIRRSVLQPTPTSVCVISSSGLQTGEC